MTSVNSSRKQFISMFKESAKKTVVLPILAFLCFIFFSLNNSIWLIDRFNHEISPFFWDELRSGGVTNIAGFCFIAAGLINAMVLFSFAWSKKHSNVIFSLGMKRKDIYFAKILGGILPMTVSILAAALVETICYCSFELPLNLHFIGMATLTALQFLAIYILAFMLGSAVFSNVGNVVEGLVFTAILSVFTIVFRIFLENLFWGATHGASVITVFDLNRANFNWSMPFLAFYDFGDESFMNMYFDTFEPRNLTIFHWSGTICAFVYSVVICLLGYLAFRKRKNEICGTWGRAKVMNEVAGSATAFYAFVLISQYIFYSDHGDAHVSNLIIGLVTFLIVSIIFKLIFGYKRRKEIKNTLKKFPIYVIGFAAFFTVFSSGLFGYSSYIPDTTEIEKVTVASTNHIFMEDSLSTSSEFALFNQRIYHTENSSVSLDNSLSYSYYIDEFYTGIIFSSPEEINKVIKIHEKLISDGKIKNSGADSVGASIEITYTLKDGSICRRYYTEATESLFKELLLLDDTKPVEYTLRDYLGNNESFSKVTSYITEYNKTEGYVVDLTTNWFTDTYHDSGLYAFNKASMLVSESYYIFPKDMSKGYWFGNADDELFEAIYTDLLNLTAEQYYHHSAEDEIGVLSFGLSSSMTIDDNGDIVYSNYDELSDGDYASASWNLNSHDVKTVLITKYMTNTIKYLEKHDLMKYFENQFDIDDIKSVKLATPGELYGENYRSKRLPIFYAAYWTGKQMNAYKSMYGDNMNHTFENIENVVTDKAKIQSLLDNSVLYGFCSNENQIMEITYVDGSTATVLVK